RFLLGPPHSGATRPFRAGSSSLFHPYGCACALDADLSGRSCRPPRLTGAGCGSFGVMEAVMSHANSKVSENGTGRTTKAKRAARKARRGGRAAPKHSLYDEVTAQIIAQLEEGVLPWVKPWDSGNA